MDSKTLEIYKRAKGWRSRETIFDRFRKMEAAGLVRFRWEADQRTSISDLDGDKRELASFILECEQEGVWGAIGEYRISSDTDEWEYGESYWGFIGKDCHGYESDILATTLDALEAAQRKAVVRSETLEAIYRACLLYRRDLPAPIQAALDKHEAQTATTLK